MINTKEWLEKLGLSKMADDVEPYSYKSEDYKLSTDKDKVEAHKNYLQNIENEESNRLTLIEGKTSQLISQTGIIFSLLSLFVPILVDKVDSLNFFSKLVLLILLVTAFLFYMLTIRNALKNFNVKEFKYSKPSPQNVLKLQDKDLLHFYSEEVKDLLYTINNNLKINNKKATNLIHSYNSFKIANITTGILVSLFSVMLLLFNSKADEVEINKPLEIKNFDKLINNVKELTSLKKDTIYIVDSSALKMKLQQRDHNK